jgi:hypothetical protein
MEPLLTAAMSRLPSGVPEDRETAFGKFLAKYHDIPTKLPVFRYQEVQEALEKGTFNVKDGKLNPAAG